MTEQTISERIEAAIRSVTDLWDEPLDEVHDVPQIVNALLAAGIMQEVRAEAWDEAAAWVDDNDPGWGEQVRDANPYRAEQIGQGS